MHRRAEAGNTAAESVPLGTASDVAVDVSAADDPPLKFAPNLSAATPPSRGDALESLAKG